MHPVKVNPIYHSAYPKLTVEIFLVMHPVRCNVCDSQPIQGFRYQCLQCLSYNQCQQCFWLGLVSKGHKVTHQMQEYCAKVNFYNS